MSSQLRYRRGDCKPVSMLCDSTYPIEKGDLLFVVPTGQTKAGYVRPTSAMVDQGTLALNQDAFQQYFAGVAMEKKGAQSGETLPLNSPMNTSPTDVIEVATEGEFEFDCDSHAWATGELVGGCENAAGTALKNQKVAPLTAGAESKAIGKAVPPAHALGNATTTVVVAIKSTIMDAGVLQQIAGSSSGVI